jgi:hypothetical protein
MSEYTFVSLDNDVLTTGEALFVDIDDTAGFDMDFVQIDDSYDGSIDDSSDFITLDGVEMIYDTDIDSYSSDINEVDVSILV